MSWLTMSWVLGAPPLYRLNSSIDHQLAAAPVRATLTYCAVWAGKLTISAVPVPVQLATVAQELASSETCR